MDAKIGLESLESYLRVNQLRWLGHVMGMEMTRLLRKVISIWVKNPRPRGRPQFNFGHSVVKQLKKANIDKDKLLELSSDRQTWRQSIMA